MPPWLWDLDYPEDMYGVYYPEDTNALVQIDSEIAKEIKRVREKNANRSRGSGIG